MTCRWLFVVASLVPIAASRIKDGQEIVPRAFSRSGAQLMRLTRRRMSTGSMDKEAFKDYLQQFMTESKSTSRQLLDEAMKGSGTRAYEAAMRAYRPTGNKVSQMLAGYGHGPQGRMVTDSIQRSFQTNGHNIFKSFTGQGFAEQIARGGQNQADLMLHKIQARVPMIEAGALVKNVWKTPIPQHLKGLVQDAVIGAFKAGKYGSGQQAEKVLQESMKFIGKSAGLGLFVGVNLYGGAGQMDELMGDGSDGKTQVSKEESPTEKALEMVREEPSLNSVTLAAQALDEPPQEVLASTVRYFMGQAIEAGTMAGDAVQPDAFLDEVCGTFAALSPEELAENRPEIDAMLRTAQGLIETRQGLDEMLGVESPQEVEAPSQEDDFSDVRLESEDLSTMEELE